MVAIDQPAAAGQFVLGAMRETGPRDRDSETAAKRIVGDLTESDERIEVRQVVDRRHQEGTAIRFLDR
jgi:hypothetical protein